MAISDYRQKFDSSTNISIGNISDSQVVTGKDNAVNQTTNKSGGDVINADQQAYIQAKTELLAAIREHEAEIPDAKYLPDVVNSVNEEIEKEQPNKTKVRMLLESLYAQVNAISGVAVKVNALKSAVSLLLGL